MDIAMYQELIDKDVSKKTIFRMILQGRNARELEALENGGVDNWDYYGESLKTLEETEEQKKDFEELLIKVRELEK